MSIARYIFIVIPEILIVSFFALGLVGVKGKLDDYFKIALLYTVGLWVVREVFNLYGLHLFIVLIMMVLLFKFILRIKWLLSVTATLIGFVSLGILENIVILSVISRFGVDYNYIIEHSYLVYIVSYLTTTPLLIIAILSQHYNFKLVKGSLIESQGENLS